MILSQKKNRIWHIFSSHLLIIICTIISVIWMANHYFKSFYIEQATNELRTIAQLVSTSEIKNNQSFGRLRVSIISPEGTVIFDSAEFSENMENHFLRPEVQTAIRGGEGIQIRYSDILKEDMLYLARPITNNDDLLKIVRVSVPITSIHYVLNKFYFNLFFGAILVIIISGVITFFISRFLLNILHRRNENEKLVLKLKKLEKMRKEFVGNVSHELKTPITLIKGFIETLQDGAAKNPKDLNRFLGIIQTHSERLNNIIEDLLTLSKIEMEGENTTLEFVDVKLKPVLSRVLQLCETKSNEKAITIHLDCSSELIVKINPPLIEQAVVNLIDNAIKFSKNNSTVSCLVSKTDTINIEVKDTGNGIEKKHLPRLFQRFYRIDKARSRKQGGTGLGLAIVKHIAQAHGGNVSVESELGKGSSFFILLPL